MRQIIDIIDKNSSTYYDYETGKPEPLRNIYLWPSVVSIIGAVAFSAPSSNFITIIVTIYAILIGFSFNVLFYLLSIDKLKVSEKIDSLEIKGRITRLNRLNDELFYNVSYFNLVSVGVLILALVFFAFESRTPRLAEQAISALGGRRLYDNIDDFLVSIRLIFMSAYRVIMYFLLVESLFSFLRSTFRISFYFEERRTLRQKLPVDHNA
jgi:uncharacterized membrane protein